VRHSARRFDRQTEPILNYFTTYEKSVGRSYPEIDMRHKNSTQLVAFCDRLGAVLIYVLSMSQIITT